MHNMIPLFIFVGSGVGGVMRWLIGGWAQRLANGPFPAGTLAVNVIGCFLIGFLTVAMTGRFMPREEFRIAILVGLLGGFTTFSTFGFETFALINDGQMFRALLNIVASVILGLTAVWLGYRLAEGWLGV